jgi:hypothetical protein
MDADYVDCLLKANSWRHLKTRPADCDVDWFPAEMGMSVDLRTGRWTVSIGGCRGDIGSLCYPDDPCSVLRYGRSIQSVITRNEPRGIRCTSAKNGITCRKIGLKPGVHGFRIAYKGYVIF